MNLPIATVARTSWWQRFAASLRNVVRPADPDPESEPFRSIIELQVVAAANRQIARWNDDVRELEAEIFALRALLKANGIAAPSRVYRKPPPTLIPGSGMKRHG